MKYFLSLLCAALFVLFLLRQYAPPPAGHSPPLTTATLRDFQVTVRTVGTLQAVNSHLVASRIKGPGAKIIFLAQDGYPVKKGDILVRFDPTRFEEEIAECTAQIDDLTAGLEAAEQLLHWEKIEVGHKNETARYSLRVAELDLQRLVKGDGPMTLAQHRDERDKAKLELKRYQEYAVDLEKLAQEGYENPAELTRIRDKIRVLQEEFASAKRRYTAYHDFILPSLTETATAKVENAKLSLQQTSKAGVHEIARAKAAVDQVQAKLQAARAALRQVEAELEKTTLYAPFNGLVIHHEAFRNGEMRTAQEGDTVIINQPILSLPDLSSLIVKSKVREIDLHKIAVGQPALITLDAYPSLHLQGELAFIGALAQKQQGRRSGEKYFQAHFALKTSEKRLRPGMSARVELQTAQVTQALSLPIEAVFQDNGGPFCYVQTGTEVQQRSLQTGQSNEHLIEITEGLAKGEQVFLVRPDGY
ncbi:MAG: efflux RND transporter periplasmic adaptor subunit [Candidatus Electrothrix sp. GW3-4]|uniref:efflux RND transporter periplasmic adaptor subunit n=1 Tax=Candidatus Electrothrix sp. GW3-4 TaxID=3126740 RepID=UPI0030CF6BCC